jgi:ketosteroid isomerase-like protein
MLTYNQLTMKKLQNLSILMIPIICLLVSCQQPGHKISKAEMRNIVEKQNDSLETFFKEGNADKLAAMYTDSAKLSPNGGNFVVGRDSIKAFWAEDFKSSKLLEMKTTVLTIDGNEDVIYETGKAVSKFLINDTVPYEAKVKYINVWKKQLNGSYKLDIDFWNKDAPVKK